MKPLLITLVRTKECVRCIRYDEVKPAAGAKRKLAGAVFIRKEFAPAHGAGATITVSIPEGIPEGISDASLD